MFSRALLQSILFISICAGALPAQTPTKVDFARDVLPILRQNCIGCHGPAKQMNSYRLDRRSVALRTLGPVSPGNSGSSRLYLRLISNEFGSPMPPTGSLKPAEIAVIKEWIDEGALWPEELANEADLPPANPKAVTMIQALAAGDRQSFMKVVAEDPKLLNVRGPEGSTPFMYAVLYSDAATLRQLLQKGADPNTRNDANATALIWAATDLEKTRLLVEAGADMNVRSSDARTPLFVAAGRPGGAPIVKLLLDRGADAKVTGQSPVETPLTEAAFAADAESIQLLMDHGAETRIAGSLALAVGLVTNCGKCVDLVANNLDERAYTEGLREIASNPSVYALSSKLFATRSTHLPQLVTKPTASARLPAILVSAPWSISNWMLSASAAKAASVSGVSTGDWPVTFASAPRSSKSFTIGAPPGLPAATKRGVLASLDRTFTSAPASTSNRVFSRSVAAHISAVAFASLRVFGSAPFCSNWRRVAASEYKTAYIKGVDPSGPRTLSSFGSSATTFMKDCLSPAANAWIIVTAFGFAGGKSASLANSSGHNAPSSIHSLITAISAGFSEPVGGIGLPNSLEMRRR